MVHLHEDFHIGVSEVGACLWKYRRTRHRVIPGYVQIAQPGETSSCEFHVAREYRFRALTMPAGELQRVASDIADRQLGSVSFDADLVASQTLQAQFIALHHRIMDATSTLETDTALLQLIALLTYRARSGARPQGKTPSAALLAVRSYLVDNFADDVSLNELAKLANTSASYLVRAFRNSFGLPPHAYRNHRRIAEAKRLLRDGIPGGQVAFRVGFADQSHFIRHFRKQAGMTPTAYRRSLLAH